MKLLMVLALVGLFLYGIESKTLATENDMTDKNEEGFDDDIENMSLDEENADDEDDGQQIQEEEAAVAEKNEANLEESGENNKVTDNGWGTRRVCGYFHYKKSYHRRSCYKIKVGRVVARTKTICAKDKFYYCGWRKRRVCITSQEGYRVKYKKVYRCSSYTKTRLVKGGYQCKNYYFKYRSAMSNQAKVAQN